jgi:hypothetical protein
VSEQLTEWWRIARIDGVMTKIVVIAIIGAGAFWLAT